MEKYINDELLNKFENEYLKHKEYKVIGNAIKKNGIFNVAYNEDSLKDLKPNFNLEVKNIGEITNQKQSGRCWMFAGLNVLRKILIKNLKVDDIELSESYLFFYDKIEKSNTILEEVISSIDEKEDSRLLDSIVMNIGPENDGGYWHYFTNLVKKYGVCPKDVKGEVYSSSKSSEMDYLLEVLIKKDVVILRNDYKLNKDLNHLRELKETMLKDIYKLLSMCLGTPLKEFDYIYKGKDESKKDEDNKESKKEEKESSENKLNVIHTTPKKFYEDYIKEDLDEYVVLTNYPCTGFKDYEVYSQKLITNVVEGSKIKIYNVPIEELKYSVIESFKNNEVCWFACDVGSSSLRMDGYLSTEILPFNDLFDIDFNYSKGDRALFKASTCNHAMVLGGCNLDSNGKPTIWKVINSWGSDCGVKGIYIMSDKWFNEYTYEVVVKKSRLSSKVKEMLNKEPIEKEIWNSIF